MVSEFERDEQVLHAQVDIIANDDVSLDVRQGDVVACWRDKQRVRREIVAYKKKSLTV